MSKLNVLLTGASGRMGKRVVKPLQMRFALRTLDIQPVPDDPDALMVDLRDFDGLKSAMQGIDVLVHLAATSDEAPFLEQLLPNNIEGLYKTYQAAHEAGVRRVVFASTCQAMLNHDPGRPIGAEDPYAPCTMYGATKAFGEVLGRFYHDKHGLEFIAIRIGWFEPYDHERLNVAGVHRDIWLSPRDGDQLLCRAIETPGIGFLIVSGTSSTDRERLSLKEAREHLGYEPEDDTIKLYGRPKE